MNGAETIVKEPEAFGQERSFNYDYSFWSHDEKSTGHANQEQVFQDIGIRIVDNAFQGYNTSLFAYGQTGR